MIVKDYKDQSEEYFGGRAIVEVYKGLRLVWSAIKSCFGSGRWINERPWVNSDGWKNSSN